MGDDPSGEASSGTPQVVVPALPPGTSNYAIEAAHAGAVMGTSLDWLSGYASAAGLPSPDDCGIELDYDTMAAVGAVLTAWAGALLKAAGRTQPAESPAGGGATLTAPPGMLAAPSGLHLPPDALLLPPGVRGPDRP